MNKLIVPLGLLWVAASLFIGVSLMRSPAADAPQEKQYAPASKAVKSPESASPQAGPSANSAAKATVKVGGDDAAAAVVNIKK